MDERSFRETNPIEMICLELLNFSKRILITFCMKNILIMEHVVTSGNWPGAFRYSTLYQSAQLCSEQPHQAGRTKCEGIRKERWVR